MPSNLVTIATPGPQGPPGPAGASGAGGYEFTQASPALTWTVNHNLGFRPSVELLTTGWQEMVADVVHTSVNQFIVYFNAATAGYARAN